MARAGRSGRRHPHLRPYGLALYGQTCSRKVKAALLKSLQASR